ncbi:MAG: CZB domain-containing protein, partial [Spirochaetes bacterium]|nr:CZB domain-containing protein [Spirochaetota bacterium]
MTTRLKVQGGLIVMAVVFAVIAGISIVSFFSLSRNTDELQSGLGQQSFYLMRTIDHLEWDKKLTDHIYQGGTAKVETDPHKCKLGEWFYPYLNSDEFRALPEKTRSRLLELKEPHRQLHESAADVMAHMMKGDTNGAAALYKSRVEPNLLQVRGIINGLNRDLEGMAESRKASIVAVLSSSKTAIIVSMVIGAGVLLFVFFITFNAMGIMDKLKPFKEQFSKSAMGDLTSHYALKSVNCSAIMGCGNKECPDFGRDGVLCWFDVGSYAPEFGKEIHCPKILTKEYKSCLECRVYRMVNIDEVATLAAWYNKFMDNLEETVSNVIVASQNLAQAVEQISSGNQNLSQRTS